MVGAGKSLVERRRGLEEGGHRRNSEDDGSLSQSVLSMGSILELVLSMLLGKLCPPWRMLKGRRTGTLPPILVEGGPRPKSSRMLGRLLPPCLCVALGPDMMVVQGCCDFGRWVSGNS